MLNPDHGIGCHTDGSCYHVDRTGGWAWVAFDAHGNEESASGSVRDTTISQMELLAPTQALIQLWSRYGPSDVLMYSDSQYVVLGCQNPSRNRLKNIDFWDRLDWAINQHEYVEFEHVKGHADSHYNNMVDKLAGEARKREADAVRKITT